MDRFDCQFLMATFVNVYISSFIRTASPQKLLAQVWSENYSTYIPLNFSSVSTILGLQFETRAATATLSSS